MALDPTVAACGLLNSTSYPTLFTVSGYLGEVYPTISTNGTLNTYLTMLNAVNKNNNILASVNPNSSYRLIKFLSNAPSGSNPDYRLLANVALKTTSYKTIVDSYIIGSYGITENTYTFPTSATPLLSDANLDDIITKLTTDFFLLNKDDIYMENQFQPGASIASGTESLVYLYHLQEAGTTLLPSQLSRLDLLENKNLRFFGAFMAEYCFYRQRYMWLLEKYFTIYIQSATNTPATYNAIVDQALLTALFGSSNTYVGTLAEKQTVHLSRIAYHMACLNTRMVDMQRLLTRINKTYNDFYVLIHENINSTTLSGGNKALITTIGALQDSSNDAKKYLTDTDFAKEAMTYNSEKNRYSNILLGLYAFLNISALATIFQLARSS